MEEYPIKSNLKCLFCEKSLATLYNLRRHLRNVHGQGTYKELKTLRAHEHYNLREFKTVHAQKHSYLNELKTVHSQGHPTLPEGEILKEFTDFSGK